ncbi:MAG: PQQ-binding-like beta-propeller repeat protein [Pirellulaceae bacterium]
MKSIYFLLILIAGHSAVARSALADNWPHWRGPTGNGTSLTATPPTEWSETKNVQWKVPIAGKSSGSPVVWGDRVFVVTAIPDASAQPSSPPPPSDRQRGGRRGRGSQPIVKMQFRVLCFNRENGELLWDELAIESKPHEGTHSTNGFASASPCTDGKHVYAHFGSRGLYCYTIDGELKWSRTDFSKMQTRATFGEGSSPTLVDDMIIVPYDHEGPSKLYALNKLTGEIVWETDRDEPTCWATPLIVGSGENRQIVMNGQTSARGYDLASGKELWKCAGQTQRPVATPVANDDFVYVGSGYRGAFLGAFKLDGSGNIEGTDAVAWTINRDTPDIASFLLSENRLYYHKAKTGILACVEASTGKPFFAEERLPEIRTTYASPIAAGGYVFSTGRSGTTVVIKDSETPEVVSVNSVGEGVDATPAAADNQLFIRGEKHLFCIAAE